MQPDLSLIVARAHAHELAGQSLQAAALYGLALRLDPQRADVRARLVALGVDVGASPEGGPSEAPAVVLESVLAPFRRGRLDASARAAIQALQQWPGSARLWNRLGVVSNRLDRPEQAERAYRVAIDLAPDDAEALYNLGNLLKGRGRLDEAVTVYQQALAIEPDSARTHNNLANVLQHLGRYADAIAHYERALEIDPRREVSLFNLGNVLWEVGRAHDSIAAYRKAIELRPDYAKAHHNLANNLRDTGDLPAAVHHYGLAFQADPSMDTSLASMLHQQAQMCDWQAWRTFQGIAETLGITGQAVPPFDTFAFEDHPERLLLRTRGYVAEKTRERRPPTYTRPAARPPRLRIGYLSADFHDHATMYLLAGVLRGHDRERFELHAISYGQRKRGAMRELAREHVDAFHEVSGRTDRQITRLCRDLDLHLAIDLKGWTKHSRPQVFADRIAPVQIGYLGYPGSMGAAFMDYIVADPVVLPPDQRPFYDEAVLYLPDCYQCTDDARLVADVVTTRADHGLPEDGVVLCCLNKTYKLSPHEMDIWARVMQQVDDAVLWLFRANEHVEANLRREAQARGLDPDRLVFAERLPHHEHLARYRHADLFVDTFAVNAHTTASDALWAGCPVLTLAGQQFPARVAASILHAVGLPELVTHTPAAYEARLLELCTDRARLAALRHKLAANRRTTPLFDTPAITRHLEQAYDAAYQHWLEGRGPTDTWVGRT